MSKLKPKNDLKFKTFEFKIEEADEVKDEGRIEGYASTFGNVDLGLDIVVKGAFKKTLKENKGVWPILADHDPYKQIGWNEEAEEDDKGLFAVSMIDLNVQLGKERFSLAKKAKKFGARVGMSIGYTTINAEPDRDNPRITRLTELKLWEHSLVTFPMNTEALVTAAKGIGEVDKIQFLIQHLKNEGVSLKDLEIALRKEAAHVDEDPALIGQSIDNLILKFKS
jgi:HK97 family phage prohead protease